MPPLPALPITSQLTSAGTMQLHHVVDQQACQPNNTVVLLYSDNWCCKFTSGIPAPPTCALICASAVTAVLTQE